MSLKVLSLAIGAIWGLLAWMFLRAVNPENAWMAIPAGIGVTLLLYALLQIILHFEDKRYAQVEAGFSETPCFACFISAGKSAVYESISLRAVSSLSAWTKSPDLILQCPFPVFRRFSERKRAAL